MADGCNSIEQEQLWEAYVRAAYKAQESHDLEDGIAAGVAWRAWLHSFLEVADD